MKSGIHALVAVGLLAAAGSAHAGTVYNSPVSPGWFVGTGQPNSGFVVDSGNGVQLGLNGMYRFLGGQNNVITSNNYEFDRGLSPTSGSDPTPAAGLAKWDARFHINLGTRNFANTNVFLDIDWDPTAGVDLQTYNISSLLGNNANLSLFQESENLGFSFWGHSFDPNATGTYTFRLRAYTNSIPPPGQVEQLLSDVSMNVLVVPLPAPVLTGAAGLGMVGLVGGAIRRRRAR